MEKEPIKAIFKRLLEEPDAVCVENFYEKMEESNKIIPWSNKLSHDFKKYNSIVEKYNPNELELLAEGFRCLAQIHINLIKDFDIFKINPIRKYSSAYNYITQIEDNNVLIKNLGYVEKAEEKLFRLKDDLTHIEDMEQAVDAALNLLMCFMEVSELIKLRYDMCETKDLIQQRETYIKENIERQTFSQMTDEEKMNLFRVCEVCDGQMDLENGSCEVCEFSIVDFANAPKYKDFIKKKFNLTVKQEDENLESSLKLPPTPTSLLQSFPKAVNSKLVDAKTRDNTWNCSQCTFANESKNINCVICEGPRK